MVRSGPGRGRGRAALEMSPAASATDIWLYGWEPRRVYSRGADGGGDELSEKSAAGSGGWRRRPGAADRRELRAGLPAAGGLCPDCGHLLVLRSARSRFVRCGLADSDPAYSRYPALPVLACPGYEPWDAE